MGPMSYEGSEKYIFISYAHRDSDRVMHILEKLVENGYRIWYDDGIAPGSEWPEDIAQHLDGCAAFMSFISNASMDSANCRREINFALSRQKPFLGIVMEPTKMTLGMEMQLSSQHCLMLENYRTESDFLRKLFSSPDLDCCKAPQQPAAVPAADTLPIPAAPVQPVSVSPVPQPLPEQNPEPAPPKARPPKKKKGKVVDGDISTGKQTGGKRLRTVLIAVALSCAVILGYLGLITVNVAPDVVANTSDKTLTLREKEITPAVVKKINSMKQLESLYIYECTETEAALKKLNVPNLRVIDIKSTAVSDFSFMENSPDIYRVTLSDCGVDNDDFAVIASENIKYLDLSENKDFSALHLNQSELLYNVFLAGTAVSDITPLTSCKGLTLVDCRNTRVTDISCLAELDKLQTLKFSGCALKDVTVPFMSLSMKRIEFNSCGLTNLDGFQYFTVLETADLGSNRLEDISWLQKSTVTLKDVDVSYNGLDREDIWFLRDAVGMTRLNISGIAVWDAELLANMLELEELHAVACELKSISHLNRLTALNSLYLSHNKLQDISGLPAFAQTGGRLDLAYNEIEDIRPIGGERTRAVALQGNPIRYDTDCLADVKSSLLVVDYTDGIESAGASEIGRIYVIDCPPDQQLPLKDALGFALTCTTEQEALQALASAGIHYPTD